MSRGLLWFEGFVIAVVTLLMGLWWHCHISHLEIVVNNDTLIRWSVWEEATFHPQADWDGEAGLIEDAYHTWTPSHTSFPFYSHISNYASPSRRLIFMSYLICMCMCSSLSWHTALLRLVSPVPNVPYSHSVPLYFFPLFCFQFWGAFLFCFGLGLAILVTWGSS